MIFLKAIKKFGCFFDRIEHDIRLFNLKPALIIGAITLSLGILGWIIGGSSDRALLLYMFPRSAISVGFMYFLWGIAFTFVGIIIGGILFGCEKYKRRESTKSAVFVIISLIFAICVHPMFFRCLAPFITFVFLLVSIFFCFLAIMSVVRIYSLWSICLMIHMLWLAYNGYLAFAIALIN